MSNNDKIFLLNLKSREPRKTQTYSEYIFFILFFNLWLNLSYEILTGLTQNKIRQQDRDKSRRQNNRYQQIFIQDLKSNGIEETRAKRQTILITLKQ